MDKPKPSKPADQVAAVLEDVPDSVYDVNVKDVYDLGGGPQSNLKLWKEV
jgi:hypothetical protein